MANVSMADLRSTLENCVEFCREHAERDYCQRHLPLLENALEDLEEGCRATDEYFATWRERQREEKLAWKHLAKRLSETQKELDRLDATGYPDKKVMYWDQERLEEAVEEMIDYLEAHTDQYEVAADLAETLERKLGMAEETVEDQEAALDGYRSKIKKRSDAMGGAAQAIRDFRELMRDELGQEHDDYQSIRWPYGISPDEATF